ncbi:unnamed protein product [Cyclocybe aegerita]|uniref:CHAT domain-containing protein n=1 Tax=Cyclocybe aegerita TaxID=1973307 RepID=A0A8S0XYG9_CYCAE|nr:unnamed protein product [Cyclocybe aegerita]
MENFALGIDLGNETIKISYGSRVPSGGAGTLKALSFPARVGVGSRKRLFGDAAKPGFPTTIHSLKRLVSSYQEKMLQQSLPYMNSNEDSNSTLLAMMLGHIRRKIEDESGCPAVIDTVLAVPRWYTDTHLQTLADCAVISGLHPVGFITDIVGIALGYGIAQMGVLENATRPRVVAFLDIGESDCASAVVTYTEGCMKVHEVITDPDIGGKDVDRLLLKHFSYQPQNQGSVRLEDEKTQVPLLKECEKLKKLSSDAKSKQSIDFSSITRVTSDKFELTEGQFQNIIADWLERVFDPLQVVLTLSGIEESEVDALELVGGSSQLACVLEHARKRFGETIPNISAKPSLSAANGAANACSLIRVRQRNAPIMYDTQITPFEMRWAAPFDDKQDPWLPLDHEYRLDDLQLVSLMESELAMEEADKLARSTQAMHEELVEQISKLSEEVLKLDPNTQTAIIENVHKTIDCAVRWMTSNEEKSGPLYDAHFQALRAAENQIESATTSRGGSSKDLYSSLRPMPATVPVKIEDETGFTPDQRRVHMFDMGTYLIAQYAQFEKIEHIEEAIPCLETALELLKGSTSYAAEATDYHECLASAFSYRFEYRANEPDVESAIRHCRYALEAAGKIGLRAIKATNNLGLSLCRRYEYLTKSEDLDEAISLLWKVVQSSPDSASAKPQYLSNLGAALCRRFEAKGDKVDIDKALPLCRRAAEIVRSPSYAQMAFFGREDTRLKCLSSLGTALRSRFDRFREVHADIDDAIRFCEDAVQSARALGKEQPTFSHALGTVLRSRFEVSGNINDIDPAIAACEDAVRLTQKGHPEHPNYLAGLSICLATRYDRFGRADDIRRSLELAEEAVSEMPDGRPLCFATLGRGLAMRFEQLGEITDIDKAIRVQQKAVDQLPESHVSLPTCLDNLARSLSRRFTKLFQMSDIEKAISEERRAMALLPKVHPERFLITVNLGGHFFTKFNRTKKKEDIQMALEANRDAMKLLPDNHPNQSILECALATTLVGHFNSTEEQSALDEAIELHRRAAERTNDKNPHKIAYIGNLSNALIKRYTTRHQETDINEAVACMEEATKMVPEDHPERPATLRVLADALITRYLHLHVSSDLERATSIYSQAAKSHAGAPWTRFIAAKNWVTCAKGGKHSTLRDAYDCWLDLLPRVAWIGLRLEDRREEIMKMGSIACEAAAEAISMGDFKTAVTWLEKGRFIIWSQGLSLRNPMDDLKAAHPELAQRAMEVSMALERSVNDGSQLGNKNHPDLYNAEKVAGRQRRFADAWDKLLGVIRSKKDFKNFLLPRTFAELIKSAENHPVAIINPSESRCDALVLNKGRVQHVGLTLTYEQVKTMLQQLRTMLRTSGREWRGTGLETSPDVERDFDPRGGRKAVSPPSKPDNWTEFLLALWREIARPVLQALQLRPSSDPPPGDYRERKASISVHNYAISSYTPTLGLLLIQRPSMSQSSVPNVLVVGVSRADIPGVNVSPLPMDGNATLDNILKSIISCSVVHLACHAHQHLLDPLSSAFLVHGEKLLLSKIVEASSKKAELAILSACQTAKGDENTPDEAIHLAGGMLFAGFPTVIATMWAIDDYDAPEVTKAIYEATSCGIGVASDCGIHARARGGICKMGPFRLSWYLRQEVCRVWGLFNCGRYPYSSESE